jgi:predicted metal-binding membrane protein
MFPSVSPTVALYSRMTRQRSFLSPLLFTAGYLATWTAAGLCAFLLALAGGRIAGDPLPGIARDDGSPARRSWSQPSTS